MSENTTDESTNPELETESAGSAAVQEQAETQSPLESLEQEVLKWKDLAHRNAADLDNYRKRMAREMQEARTYANADLLRSLLPILDNFEMGLQAAKAENENSMIYIGMNMVRGQLADFLKDQGLEEINASNVPFDPNFHDAVKYEPSTEVPEGNVLQVLRRGFKLKDRLLRAATVSVSSGPEAPPAE